MKKQFLVNMEITQFILFIFYLITLGQCQMEPYIVNGQEGSIEQFPYSALLYIDCEDKSGDSSVYSCGSSIVNQFLLLTAAHCTDSCEKNTLITVYVGHTISFKGASSIAHSFLQHENYNNNYDVVNDICLVRLKTRLEFSRKVSRVALMENPPYDEEARIAGWGASDIYYHGPSDQLYYLKEQVQRGEACPERGDDPTVFCTHPKNNTYPSFGDSGSALVVRNYIQLGIASFQYVPEGGHTYDKPAATFYTDTGYFYNCIEEKSIYIMCFDGGPFPNATSDCIIARDYSGEQKEVKKIL